MTSVPLLTVVTVVKDDPDGLARTLASLAGEDLTGVEYLVVDSSADREATGAVLAIFGVPASVAWTEPAGIYAAMNHGLALAHGRYVHFLNAGDEFAPGAVDRIRTALGSGAPAWLYGAVEIVGADGTVVVTPPLDLEAERAHAFARGRFAAHQGTVARVDLLRSHGGFDTSYRITADYAAFLHLAQAGSPVLLPGVIARFHEGGASTTGWARSLREFHHARQAILRPTGGLARREQLATARQFAAMAAHRSPWPLIAALAMLVWAFMGLTGVSWGTAGLLTAAVALQGLGGALWWRLLRPRRSVPILEAAGMGLGLGTAAAMLTGLFIGWWLAPVVALAGWWGLRWRGRRVAPLAPLQRADLLALVVGLVPGLGALGIALRNYPLAWSGLWTGYHGDMAFFEALAASVARLGPGASIFMDGADLRYHSLAYGWAGQLTLAVDAAPFVVMTRLLPVVMLIAAVALAGAWTRHLTRAWWAPALAVGLVVTGGFVGATYGGVLNFDSPSQTVSTVWLLALSIVLMQGLERVSLGWHAFAVAALVVAITGGKVSTAAIAAAGFAAVVVVGLVRRSAWRWRAAVLAGAGGVALVAAYVWLLAGSANAGGLAIFSLLDRASSVQGLNPVVTPRGILVGIVLLILAVLPRWAGLAWLIGDRETRWQPQTAYGTGLALGGVGTLALLSGGFNDLWFAVAASGPLAVLSAAGVAGAATWLGPQASQRVLLAGMIGIGGSLAVAAVWATGSTGIIGNGWRWAAPLVGWLLALAVGLLLAQRGPTPRWVGVIAFTAIALVTMALPSRLLYTLVEPYARGGDARWTPVLFSTQDDFVDVIDDDRSLGWTSEQAQIGAWLRRAASPDEVVVTNMTRGALVPALTRLRTYLSDIPLQTPYGRWADVDVAKQRERESWAFIDNPSRASLSPLCEAGVTWVWVDPRKTTTHDWAPFADVVRSGAEVTLLRVNPSACR